jgi:hypothetical protein
MLYALNGGRDEVSGEQIGPNLAPVTGDLLDYDEVMKRLDPMMDWLAKTYVNALNVIHFMHDKYSYEAIEMALHDRDVLRTLACGIAGLSHAADSLGDQHAKVSRCATSAASSWTSRPRVTSLLRQQRRPVDDLAVAVSMMTPRFGASSTRRCPYPVGADHHPTWCTASPPATRRMAARRANLRARRQSVERQGRAWCAGGAVKWSPRSPTTTPRTASR